MRKNLQTSKPASAPGSFRANGFFRANGAWWPEGRISDRGPTDRLVRAMIASRRDPDFTPQKAAAAIYAANATAAFQCVRWWVTASDWSMCPVSSSAEAAVLYEGHATRGHWCGQRFVLFPEADCAEEHHRASPMPDDCRAILSAALANASGASVDLEVGPPPE